MVEIELGTRELAGLDSIDALWSLRSHGVALAWTPILEMGGALLNVLAPRDRILWSIGEFEALRRGQARINAALTNRRGAARAIAGVLEQAGAGSNSFSAYVAFGGLTRPFGDAFLPEMIEPDYLLLAQRHLCLLVPAECRADVSRYFFRQQEEFGLDSVRACDEGHRLSGDDDRPASDIRERLHTPIDLLSGRQSIGYDLQLESIGELRPGLDFPLSYAGRGGIHLALFRAVREVDVEDVAGVARYRADVALHHGSLPVVERVLSELDTPGWNTPLLQPVRDSIRQDLVLKLSRFPVTRCDPLIAAGGAIPQ